MIDFRLRCNNYKKRDGNSLGDLEIRQNCLHEHFSKDCHHGFKEDVSTFLTDKTVLSDLRRRKYHWMRTQKTIAPFGLNAKETYWEIYTITHFSLLLLEYINAEKL